MALEMEGFAVRTANNGEEALRVIDDEVPLAMIVDLMMPVMDGMEFRQIQRKDARTSHVPFIVVTAVQDGFNIATRLGADAFLGKPVRP